MLRALPALLLLVLSCTTEAPPPAPPDAAPARRPPPPDAAAAAAPPDAAGPRFKVEGAMDLAEAPDGSFTSGGKLPAPPPEFALFRAQAGPPAAKDRAADAKKRLASTDLATNVKVQGQRAVTIDGMQGFETGGQGTFEKKAVTLYQVVLYDESGSFTLQARSSTDRWAWYKPAFEKMARSFRRR
jgi:hypothetical protein